MNWALRTWSSSIDDVSLCYWPWKVNFGNLQPLRRLNCSVPDPCPPVRRRAVNGHKRPQRHIKFIHLSAGHPPGRYFGCPRRRGRPAQNQLGAWTENYNWPGNGRERFFNFKRRSAPGSNGGIYMKCADAPENPQQNNSKRPIISQNDMFKQKLDFFI